MVLVFVENAVSQEKDPSARSQTVPSLLVPDDVVEISVFQEDDLLTKSRLSPSGTIVFPLLGEVKIGGLTPEAATKVIRDLLAKDYLVNPQVTVSVVDYSKRRFTVLGQVQKPGSYEIPDRGEISLLEAIGIAGGYTRIANPSKITLKRIESGKEITYRINAKKMADSRANNSISIKPGDVISVAESIF